MGKKKKKTIKLDIQVNYFKIPNKDHLESMQKYHHLVVESKKKYNRKKLKQKIHKEEGD